MIRNIILLTPFVFSFAFGLDIYIPILPEMSKIFQTTPGMTQLTMSLFLLMTGLGQIAVGPLADRLGRKAIFYGASFLFGLGAIGCAFASNIETLIGWRVVSGLGACGMLVTAFAVVRDLYSHAESAKMFSFLNGMVGISPTFAPILGGNLAVYFGWQSVFYFLAFLGAFAFLITFFFVKETNRSQVQGVSIKDRYRAILKEPQFLRYAFLGGLAEGVFFCFFSISPFIIIDVHGVATQDFGYYFAAFGAVIALGGFASGKMIDKKGIFTTIKFGIACMAIGGISMLLCHVFNPAAMSGFIIPMVIACTGAMFLLGGSASLALEPFGKMAGTASAAFGAIEFGLAAFIGSLLMLFSATSAFLYSIFILILSFLSLILSDQRFFPLINETKNKIRKIIKRM